MRIRGLDISQDGKRLFILGQGQRNSERVLFLMSTNPMNIMETPSKLTIIPDSEEDYNAYCHFLKVNPHNGWIFIGTNKN